MRVGDVNVARVDGCLAGAHVELSVAGKVVGTATADGAGRAQVSFTVPDLSVGEHKATANCGRVLSAAFDVIQSSEVDQGTTTLLMLMLFVLLGGGLMQGQFSAHRRSTHG